MDNHQIDQWAREEIKDREITPRPMVWDKLEAELSKENNPAPTSRWKVIFWISGLFLIGLLWLGIQTERTEPDSQSQARTEMPTSVQKATREPNNVEKTTLPSLADDEANKPASGVSTKKPTREGKINAQKQNPAGLLPQGLEKRPEKSQPENIRVQNPNPPVAMQETKHVKAENLTGAVAAAPAEIQPKESHKYKVNPETLLAEASQEMAKTTRKYHIDPKSLLKEAEKETHDRFLQKVFKTVTETSTSVYASVASRNVEP